MSNTTSEVLRDFITNDNNTNDLTQRLAKYGTDLEWQLMFSSGSPKRISEGFTDTKIRGRHITRCGSTGWNHASKESIFVGIDIDSNTNHADGLTWRQLRQVRKSVASIPHVELRRSTNSGYHIYVWLTDGVKCNSRNDHATLANFVASQLPIKFDWLDCKGSVLWVAAQDKSPKGFRLLKSATEQFNPIGWENFRVQQTHRQKLSDDHKKAPITREHNRVLDMMRGYFTYDNEGNFFRVHTAKLKEIHSNADNNIVGNFETVSAGNNLQSFNAFMFPGPAGSFRVVRYGNAVKEHKSWKHGEQWTSTVFNQVDVDAYDFYHRDTPFRCVSDAPGTAWLEYRTKDGDYIKDARKSVEATAQSMLHISSDAARDFVSELKQHVHRLEAIPFEVDKPAPNIINLTKSFSVESEAGEFPNILKAYGHIGKALDSSVASSAVCQNLGIHSGLDYLLAWTTVLVKRPKQPLPALMLYSRTQDNGGKTTFTEALSSFMVTATNGVCWKSGNEIQGRFNSFIDGKALLVLDEVNFANDANRFKQLFGRTRVSEGKGKDARIQDQYVKLIISTNDLRAVPLDEDDTRTVCIEAPCLSTSEKDPNLDQKIRSEAKHFLHWVQNQEVCKRHGRLHLPVLQTELKTRIIETLHPDSNWQRKAAQNIAAYVQSNGDVLMTPGQLHGIANTQTVGKFTARIRTVLNECQELGLDVEGPVKHYNKIRRRTCNHYRIQKGKPNENQRYSTGVYDVSGSLPIDRAHQTLD